MISLISRYEFTSHVMLRSLCLQLEQDGHKIAREGTFLKVFKFRIYENRENVFIADDPFAFLAGMVFFWRAERKVFWMLELNMCQEKVSNVKRLLRAIAFWMATWFSLYLASKVVFPSKLRRKFVCESLGHLKIKTKSVIVPNVPKPNLGYHEVSQKFKEKVEGIVARFEKTAVYAGAMQEGRDLKQIIDHACSAGIPLILCGPMLSSGLKEKIENQSLVHYLGNLNEADLNFVYDVVSVGYVNYSDSIPNTRYCAPVKIWEYSQNGLYIFSNSNFAMKTEWADFVDLFYDADLMSGPGLTRTSIFIEEPKASNFPVDYDVLRDVVFN